MAQQYFRFNLDDTIFPLLSTQQTRTTLISNAGETGAPTKVGVQYCHNVMPTKYGMRSVSYTPRISPPSGADAASVDIRIIYGDEKSRIHLALTDTGRVFALKEDATSWVEATADLPTNFDRNLLTSGTVNGISYLCYQKYKVYTYNEATDTLVEAVLTGLSIGTVLGIVASSGYLIAYTEEAVAWSSTIDPTDFVPSQVTGAGGGNVAGIDGDILFATYNTLGILLYTTANTIAATYTGNVQYPFKFREVEGAKGGLALDLCAFEANSSDQFVYNKAGLQVINSREAKTILPEVTDFLTGKVIETYNEQTEQFDYTTIPVGSAMLKKVKYIASRYLVISYGATEFTHALILDTALNKLGKLLIDHADVFEYVGAQAEVARQSLAFISASGAVSTLELSSTIDSSGTIILGKVQYSSSRHLDLLSVEVEDIDLIADLDVFDMYSLNGKDTSSVQGYYAIEVSPLREYLFRVSAKNHSIRLSGRFDLTTLLLRYKITGRR